MKWTPAENDKIGVGFRRLSRQSERIAGNVGVAIDIRPLVVVGEQHRPRSPSRCRASAIRRCSSPRPPPLLTGKIAKN